ncbi:Viral A-type inclusion protein [Dirofilaria immitis]|nr:Viral A-type inclusion protein [Dirofilaria immitis]
MEATLTTCPQCVTYNEALNNNVEEIKIDLIKLQILQEHILKLTYKLQDESRIKEEIQEHLNDKLMRLNDYAIKVRCLEEQLQSATDRRPIDELSRAEVDGIIGRDLENIHSQLIEKDMKIMELNDTVFEKERHIIELQEMCREQRELVRAKTKAFLIIQQKLLDLETRTTREDSTETEEAYTFESTFSSLSLVQQPHEEQHYQRDSFSPGYAVVQFKLGSSGSPPPVDPSDECIEDECNSITQSNGNIQDDFDGDDGISASSLYKKKQRKKVTFDLPPRKEFKNDNGQKEGDITQAIIDVTTENDQLRKTIQEMEKCAIESQNHEIQAYISLYCVPYRRIVQWAKAVSFSVGSGFYLPKCQLRFLLSDLFHYYITDLYKLQIQLDEIQRDSQNQILKVRASMQGKIRDLEDRITAMNTEQTDKVEHLNVSIETLRADREWILEENARLLKLLGSYKEKLNDTWEALDTRQEESKKLRSKLDDDRALIVQLADDLEEAQQMANILLEQKISVLDDVGRLKEALEAQDQYIELLEKDTKIYEEHVGLLRDSLGASKAERRALIRAKAYETKLKALEQEKEQMNRRSNGKLNFYAIDFLKVH